MKLLKYTLALALTISPIIANAAALQKYQPGPRLIDGTQLNLMVDVVNALTGNSGTPSTGYFSANTGTGPTPLTGTVLQVVGANAATARIELDGYAGVPIFSSTRRNGTKASPTAILSADQLGSYNFIGASTTALTYGPASRLTSYATENWSSTAGGTKLVLSTTPNTTQTLTDVVTIDQNGATSVTSAGSSALAIGRLGTTTPALQVDASTATSITGVKIKSAATGGGVAISAIGEASNGALTLDAQGSGTIGIGSVSTGAVTITPATNIVGLATLTARLQANGKIATGATPPVLTSCGTSPSITGSDTAGIVTMGTGTPTGCVITFAAAYTGTPFCVVNWIATPLASQSYVTSNTAITTTQTATSSNKLQYVCVGPSGG